MNRAIAILVSVLVVLGAARVEAGDRPIVVELFTSEGCSSCPPADALLTELAQQRDVLALSFHVDYWDRLGWKDPFSSHQATLRQERYAELLGSGTVYTPQIVVDGRWQAVGSDRGAVESALALARRSRRDVPVAIALDEDHARIRLGPAADQASASVLLIGFDRRHVSAVARGENSGRTLSHVDVVRDVDEVGRFDGKPVAIDAAIRQGSDRVAAVLQAADGHIIGAAVGDADQR